MIALVFRVLSGGPMGQSGVTGDSTWVVIYAAITGVILKRTTATAKRGWEKRRNVSIWGGRHGGADVRGGEGAARGRNGRGSSVKTFAAVATICTPIGM